MCRLGCSSNGVGRCSVGLFVLFRFCVYFLVAAVAVAWLVIRSDFLIKLEIVHKYANSDVNICHGWITTAEVLLHF